MADNNDFTHEFQIYTTDLNAGTMGTGKFLLFDNNINALKVESIDNIKIGGGTNGRVLATDGEGNLRWISAAAGTGGVSSYNELEDLPTLFSGSYNDLTNKPTIPGEVSLGNFIFSLGDASLPAGGTMTLSTYRSGANEESRLTLSPTTESSLYAAGVLKLGTGYGSGSEQYWQFGANGVLTIPGSGDIVQNGVSVLGGGSGATALSGLSDVALEGPIEGSVLTWNDSQEHWENRSIPVATQITNTDGNNIWSVSVGTDGVVTMNTVRGGIEFGAMPEVGGPNHLHIMRPAGAEGATDLYFGDDYNYVKMPALYGPGTQGVEIGSSYNSGTVSVWTFGTDGALTLPVNGDLSINGGGITQAVDQSLFITGHDVGGGAGIYISIKDNIEGNALSQTQLLGDFFRIATDIQGNNYQWEFDNSGNLTLPQGSTINDAIEVVAVTLDQFTDGGFSGTQVFTKVSDTLYQVLPSGPTMELITGTWYLKIGVATYYNSVDRITWEVSAGALPAPVGTLTTLAGMKITVDGYDWMFDDDGNLILPAGGDIKDSTGTSVLGGGSANTGNITFSGNNITGSGGARLRSLNTTTTASYNFTPGNSDYSTAVWDGTGITFNDPTQAIYDAIWALTNFSTIEVQVGSTWFTVTYSGSSTPGMPQAPTLFINQSAVGGPLNIDVVDINIIQGTESYVEIDGSDFEVDVQDDIRIYGNDTFLLSNRSTSDPIRIETNDGSHQWSFNSDGDLILPDGGGIKNDNGNSLLFSGSYNDLSDTPASFDGDYNSLTNKPTIRIAVATGSGPGGNLQADSLALAGLNPVTDIPSTWGGDLILQGGVGGANGDLYGEVRIKSGQIGANYEWHFTTDKKIKLPAGGSIVDSTGATAFVSLATLKQVVADSTDFADFQTRIANM